MIHTDGKPTIANYGSERIAGLPMMSSSKSVDLYKPLLEAAQEVLWHCSTDNHYLGNGASLKRLREALTAILNKES